jgi:hypothetical protein
MYKVGFNAVKTVLSYLGSINCVLNQLKPGAKDIKIFGAVFFGRIFLAISFGFDMESIA